MGQVVGLKAVGLGSLFLNCLPTPGTAMHAWSRNRVYSRGSLHDSEVT